MMSYEQEHRYGVPVSSAWCKIFIQHWHCTLQHWLQFKTKDTS